MRLEQPSSLADFIREGKGPDAAASPVVVQAGPPSQTPNGDSSRSPARKQSPPSGPPMASTDPGFQESSLRTMQIRDLGLQIAGTQLEPIIRDFEAELAALGLTKLRPRFYLSTEWGVAFGSISIAMPFYLAKPELKEMQAEQVGLIEGVSKADILKYLRHEMGHVVNYAFKLYEQQDWVKLFGSITQPYIEEYRPAPFSRRFVRHLPGWYAQKHPDEDWAETFAVWMTPPHDHWRTEYDKWPTALAKLEYVDRLVKELRDREPPVKAEDRDEDVEDLSYSLHEYYSKLGPGSASGGGSDDDHLPPGLDGALTAIFEDLGLPEDSSPTDTPRKSASSLIKRMEPDLVANVYRWTGHFPERTRPMVRHLAEKADQLKQVYPADRERDVAVAITTLVTALAMNHVHRGTYLP